MDWSDESERNSLIYESVEPLARLYSPFVTLNDSFVLQEFFVPIDSFGLWMKAAKSIITEYGSGKNGNVTLLNLTIRFVKQDKGRSSFNGSSAKLPIVFLIFVE